MRSRADREAGEHSLGKALWSPQSSEDGRDIYGNMRAIGLGDVILHLTDNEIIKGVSIVAGVLDESFVGISGTAWAGKPAYRIPLEDFVPLDPPLPRDAFLKNPKYADRLRDMTEEGHKVFYASNLELNQGAYLTEAPPELVNIIRDAYRTVAGKDLPHMTRNSSELGHLSSAGETDPDYSLEDALEGLFIQSNEFADILNTLKVKKNLILQGPPGVGKTFFSKRLAYALLGSKAKHRVEMCSSTSLIRTKILSKVIVRPGRSSN